jgi:hypothetical protein
MLVVIAVCAVITTVTMVILTVTMIRIGRGLLQAEETLDRTFRSLESSALALRRITARASRLSSAVLDDVDELTARLSRLSTVVLDQVETPIRGAAALAQGVRAGTDVLAGRMWNRLRRRRADHNGG